MGRATKLLADSLFGPAFPGRFDLTLTFEHAILSIMPACLVILATPIYLRPFFKKADRFSDHGPHLWLKIILSVLLLGIEAAHLLTCLTTPELYSRTSVAANILTVLGSVCIAVILYTEHLYSIRPSTFLSVYLSITTLFHLVKARSYFLRGDLATVGALSIVSAALTFILVVLDELPRRQIIPSERWRRLGTDSLRGFWNRALFLWLNSLLAIGFKNILTIDDLQGIGDDFSSRAAYEKFEPHWIAGQFALQPAQRLNLVIRALILRWYSKQQTKNTNTLYVRPQYRPGDGNTRARSFPVSAIPPWSCVNPCSYVAS